MAGNWPPKRSTTARGAGVEVAGAGVVAEARPFDEHGFERCGGEIGDGGPEAQEPRIVLADRRDGGLLQHDLAEPDAIGIGAACRRPVGRRDPPGQIARVAVVPGEHGGGDRAAWGLFGARDLA